MINDKGNWLSKISEPGSNLSLEIGCGERKHNSRYVSIDMLDFDAVDIVGDVFEVLKQLPSGVIASIYCSHFAEHVDDLEGLLQECARVLQKGAVFDIRVPHFSSPYFYSDPTHRATFGLYTMSYYTDNSLFAREVPKYSHELNYNLQKVELNFISPKPFYFRYALKKLIGSVFNSCGYLKELWEENFCYLFPCYEVQFVLIRK